MAWCQQDSSDESESVSSWAAACDSEGATGDSSDLEASEVDKKGSQSGLIGAFIGRWHRSHGGSKGTIVGSDTSKTPTPPRSVSCGEALLLDSDGRKITDYYDVDDSSVLGEGAFGVVCVGTQRSGQVARAIKVIRKDMVARKERLKREVEIMRLLDHQNIAQLYETFEHSSHIFLVVELCAGGDLLQRIHDAGSFSEKQAALIMQQVFTAVSYMHLRGVAHRDLKPENFLFVSKGPIEGNMLKVIDFGSAGIFAPGTEPFTERTGTLYYIAPEVLPGGQATYGSQCDLWSCGVVMYVLVSGTLPFKAADDQGVLEKVRRGTYTFPSPVFGFVSEDAKELIRRMLTFDPKLRCSAEDGLNDIWTRDHARSAAPAPTAGSAVYASGKSSFANKPSNAAVHTIAGHLEEPQLEQLKEQVPGTRREP